MSAFTLIPGDPDPTDRNRSADLGSAGLPGHCLTVVVTADGQERFVIAKYSMGEADYWPDWKVIAPHEALDGLPTYLKD